MPEDEGKAAKSLVWGREGESMEFKGKLRSASLKSPAAVSRETRLFRSERDDIWGRSVKGFKRVVGRGEEDQSKGGNWILISTFEREIELMRFRIRWRRDGLKVARMAGRNRGRRIRSKEELRFIMKSLQILSSFFQGIRLYLSLCIDYEWYRGLTVGSVGPHSSEGGTDGGRTRIWDMGMRPPRRCFLVCFLCKYRSISQWIALAGCYDDGTITLGLGFNVLFAGIQLW